MSCCGGKCGCGGNCNGCTGCKAFPEKVVEGSTLAAMTVSDMLMYNGEMSVAKCRYNGEMSVAGENGCKCEGGCNCNPCNCK